MRGKGIAGEVINVILLSRISLKQHLLVKIPVGQANKNGDEQAAALCRKGIVLTDRAVPLLDVIANQQVDNLLRAVKEKT